MGLPASSRNWAHPPPALTHALPMLCRVMERYPNNGRLLKIYGRFVEYVRNGEIP